MPAEAGGLCQSGLKNRKTYFWIGLYSMRRYNVVIRGQIADLLNHDAIIRISRLGHQTSKVIKPVANPKSGW